MRSSYRLSQDLQEARRRLSECARDAEDFLAERFPGVPASVPVRAEHAAPKRGGGKEEARVSWGPHHQQWAIVYETGDKRIQLTGASLVRRCAALRTFGDLVAELGEESKVELDDIKAVIAYVRETLDRLRAEAAHPEDRGAAPSTTSGSPGSG